MRRSPTNNKPVLGVIAEFNPFHDGHRYLIEEARKTFDPAAVVAVMSGNFVQRGEPAWEDAYARAASAVRGGIDLVLQLPTPYVCAGAGFFARGGVRVLNGLGLVDHLIFGSESGDLELLCAVARAYEDMEMTGVLKKYLKKGLSFPAARQEALADEFPSLADAPIAEPNNLLGIEYIRAIAREDAAHESVPAVFSAAADTSDDAFPYQPHAAHRSMSPWTVRRKGRGEHASATALRAELLKKDDGRWERMQERLFDLIRYRMALYSPEELERTFAGGEGQERRLLRLFRTVKTREEWITCAKSRRYTYTSISRLLIRILLDMQNSAGTAVDFLFPLALNRTGAALISRAKKEKSVSVPLIGRFAPLLREAKKERENPALVRALQKEILASDVYALLSGADLYASSPLVRKPSLVGL